jgi:mRNA-degrading endonuclease RelE of RelBE toxin-antitoxin system
MERYKVYHSRRFDNDLSKFDLNFQENIDKIEDQLIENPYAGNPLNVKWFREKRIEKNRIYYLVYDDLKSILMVAISGKKNQQKVINTIKLLLSFFRNEIEKLVNEEDLT